MQSTREVVDGLTKEGFRLTRTYLAWILRDRHIPEPEKRLGGAFVWTEADVDRLRSFLIRRGRGPVSGCR